MFLQYLVSFNTWKDAYVASSTVKNNLEFLTKMVNINDKIMSADNLDNVLSAIGGLSVIGGFVDSIRVGTRFYYQLEGVTCTARNVENNFVSWLRDQDGTVIDKANVNEVISIGDVPFEPKMFDKNMDWLEIINN